MEGSCQGGVQHEDPLSQSTIIGLFSIVGFSTIPVLEFRGKFLNGTTVVFFGWFFFRYDIASKT